MDNINKLIGLPLLMTSTLVEIITPENANGLSQKVLERFGQGEPNTRSEKVHLLWGLVSERWSCILTGFEPGYGYRKHNFTVKDVELVYEGDESGILYLVDRPIENVRAQKKVYGSEDLRYRVFGSKQVYKAFFELLNRDYEGGRLKKEEYMAIRKIVLDISANVYSTSLNYFFMHKLVGLEIITAYIQRKNLDGRTVSMLKSYLPKAKLLA